MTVNLLDFEGAWVLEKRMVHDNAPNAEFRGSARFIPDGDGLFYEEKGLIKVEGQRPVSAQRVYLWREAEGGRIEVLFEDGSAFHSFDRETLEDTHWCDPDTYKVKYTFDIWPEWMVRWDVSGPNKSYRMVCTYRRPVPGD
ncbi:DUF6314 family protein [Roseovarius sp. 2305UL8-3]|uniref:DUF6314 family protein n=1 Tax=Roseovarius conchicola TaxID=3121636 RepID=UPI0035275069